MTDMDLKELLPVSEHHLRYNYVLNIMYPRPNIEGRGATHSFCFLSLEAAMIKMKEYREKIREQLAAEIVLIEERMTTWEEHSSVVYPPPDVTNWDKGIELPLPPKMINQIRVSTMRYIKPFNVKAFYLTFQSESTGNGYYNNVLASFYNPYPLIQGSELVQTNSFMK